MDWAPTELMAEVDKLARQVLSTSEQPWEDLAESGLLEVEGWLETLALVRAAGWSTVDVPVLETLVLGGPIRARAAQLGLPPDHVLTAALQEPGRPDPRQARTHLKKNGLIGEKVAIPAADRASAVLLPAFEGLFVVKAEALKPTLSRTTDDSFVGDAAFSGLLPMAQLAKRHEVGPWVDRVNLGICAFLLGVAERALGYTAAYAKERRQFGVPIGAFQAVKQRAADCWIDLQTVEVTLWRAAWLLEHAEPDDPEVRRAVLIARIMANEGAHRVVAAAQHLHGGMGYDKDYGLYRCFLLAKKWEFVLGGVNRQLGELGRWHKDQATS